MRVVVTGATGNVGTSVVRRLSAEPAVTSILGLARRTPALSLAKVAWAAADVSRDDLDRHFRGADVVVHLAWLIQPSHRLDVVEATNVVGSGRVFDAAARARVGALVYASSVGAYSPGPKDRPVDESWPTEGITTSFYSRHKVATERLLDAFEMRHSDVRVVRLRPGLIFKRESASGIRRLFLGRFVPPQLLRPSLLPVVPRTDRLAFQAVHADDVAEAYRLVVVGSARGAFNIAADPVLDGDELGRILGARPVPVPAALLRWGADLSWRAHLQPTPAGWVDLALGVPLLDTTRAREELGWTPERTAGEALRELLSGIADRASFPTPALSRSGWRGPPSRRSPPRRRPAEGLSDVALAIRSGTRPPCRGAERVSVGRGRWLIDGSTADVHRRRRGLRRHRAPPIPGSVVRLSAVGLDSVPDLSLDQPRNPLGALGGGGRGAGQGVAAGGSRGGDGDGGARH